MKFLLLTYLALLSLPLLAATPDSSIPLQYISAIKSADLVEVTGTNDIGGAEDFAIHNANAISQFIHFLTSARYTSIPKNGKIQSASRYAVRLTSHGVVVLKFQVIADSIIDLPTEASYYAESGRYSDNIMEPLLRLR